MWGALECRTVCNGTDDITMKPVLHEISQQALNTNCWVSEYMKALTWSFNIHKAVGTNEAQRANWLAQFYWICALSWPNPIGIQGKGACWWSAYRSTSGATEQGGEERCVGVGGRQEHQHTPWLTPILTISAPGQWNCVTSPEPSPRVMEGMGELDGL